ncbi:hypothetical protein [Sphingomonas sp.]
MRPLSIAFPLALAACAPTSLPAVNPQDAFFERLGSLCGKAFAGRLTTRDAADAPFAGKSLVMHVRECSDDAIRIPFHVGDDRSRTWVVTRTTTGLRLKHDHRHEDGSADTVTMYGGDTATPGTGTMQAFPADAESIATFRANGLDASIANVWEIEADEREFAYALRRPNRHFRVAFDLTSPVPSPPAPWGD